MSKIYLVSLVAILAVTACSKRSEVPTAVPATGDASNAETVVQSSAADPASAVPMGDAVLVDDIRPGFPHKVRSSERDVQTDGTVKHRMNIEFIDIDAASVADSMRKSFEAKGYKVVGPTAQDGAEKYIALAADGSKVQYSIASAGPTLKVKLGAPGAQGLIGMIWLGSAN